MISFARAFPPMMLAILLFLAPLQGQAQGAQVPFGGLKLDTTLPVEITADQLKINQADSSAVFTGNVVIGQGQMRLTGDRVRVEYAAAGGDPTGKISQLQADGNVVLVNGAEAAQSDKAVYTIESGNVVMSGNVILTQGNNALSSQHMVVDLKSGTATLQGRVKSILRTGSN